MNWTSFAAFCDRYYQAHQEGVDIHDAYEICEARRTGRLLGGLIRVSWHPGRDDRIDAEAQWLIEHGRSNGVVVDVE